MKILVYLTLFFNLVFGLETPVDYKSNIIFSKNDNKLFYGSTNISEFTCNMRRISDKSILSSNFKFGDNFKIEGYEHPSERFYHFDNSGLQKILILNSNQSVTDEVHLSPINREKFQLVGKLHIFECSNSSQEYNISYDVIKNSLYTLKINEVVEFKFIEYSKLEENLQKLGFEINFNNNELKLFMNNYELVKQNFIVSNNIILQSIFKNESSFKNIDLELSPKINNFNNLINSELYMNLNIVDYLLKRNKIILRDNGKIDGYKDDKNIFWQINALNNDFIDIYNDNLTILFSINIRKISEYSLEVKNHHSNTISNWYYGTFILDNYFTIFNEKNMKLLLLIIFLQFFIFKIHMIKNRMNKFILNIPIIVVLIMILCNNNYFNNDDNFSQFSPVMVYCFEELLSGNFPWYNFYIMSGTPIFETSTYAIFYPLSIVSFLISKYILLDKYYFINVFCLIHIIIGYNLYIYMLRRLKIKFIISVLGAFCITFNAFVLISMKSWYYSAPLFIFLSIYLIFWFNLNKFLKKGSSNLLLVLILSLINVLFLVSGNLQFYIYMKVIEGIFIMIYNNKDYYRIFFISFLLSVLFSLWYLVPIFLYTNDITRIFINNTYYDINKIFNDLINLNGFTFNSIFLLLPLLLLGTKFTSINLKINLFLKVSIIFTFLISLGNYFFVWNLFSILPIFDKMQAPFKWYFFFTILLTIYISILINKNNKFLSIRTIVLLLIVFSSINFFNNKNEAFFNWNYHNYDLSSYKLKELDGIIDKNKRIINFHSSRSTKIDWSKMNGLNLIVGNQYMYSSLLGYEPLVSDQTKLHIKNCLKDFPERYNDVGVGYIFIERNSEQLDAYSLASKMKKKVIYFDEDIIVLELLNSNGIISSKNKIDVNEIVYSTNQMLAIVNSYDENTKILLNLSYNKNLKIYVNDKLQSEEIILNKGKNTVKIKYEYEYFNILILISIFSFLVCIFILKKKEIKCIL